MNKKTIRKNSLSPWERVRVRAKNIICRALIPTFSQREKGLARKTAYRFGINAEKYAAWFLRLKGYRIIAVRYRNHMGEIDLLATRGKTLAAIEVKARRSFVECVEAVPVWKQGKINRALQMLLASNSKIAGLAGAEHRNIRFDVIGVVRGCIPYHVKDAWRP